MLYVLLQLVFQQVWLCTLVAYYIEGPFPPLPDSGGSGCGALSTAGLDFAPDHPWIHLLLFPEFHCSHWVSLTGSFSSGKLVA